MGLNACGRQAHRGKQAIQAQSAQSGASILARHSHTLPARLNGTLILSHTFVKRTRFTMLISWGIWGMRQGVKVFRSSQRRVGLALRRANRPGCPQASSAGSARQSLSCRAQQASRALLQSLL